jgi:hypothetical protein
MPRRKTQVTQEGLKLNVCHQILVYSDEVHCKENLDSKTPSTAQLPFYFQQFIALQEGILNLAVP